MNFKKMNPPVQTGINTIDMLPKNTEFHISEVKPGIPCILMNGKVCNLNGIAYKNEDFQETFAPICERIFDCKCIAFGKIIDIDMIPGIDDDMDFDFESALTRNQMPASRMPDCKIELEDIFISLSKDTIFKHRQQMLAGMVTGTKITSPDTPIYTQKKMIANSSASKEIIDFALAAAKNKATIAFYPADGKYIEGADKLSSCQCFYIDPFEVFEEDVKSFKERESTAYPDNEKAVILDKVIIEYNSTEIELSYTNKKKSSNKLLLEFIKKDIIKKVLFRGVEIDGTIKYACPL